MDDTTIFQAGGPQRHRSLLVLITGLVVLAAGAIMASSFWPQQPLDALLSGLAGLASGSLALGLAVRGLWPRQLVVAPTTGYLHTAGRPARTWEWSAVRLDWRTLSSSRFAPEEPVLVLDDGATISLEPFGVEAYHAVRERLLLGTLAASPPAAT